MWSSKCDGHKTGFQHFTLSVDGATSNNRLHVKALTPGTRNENLWHWLLRADLVNSKTIHPSISFLGRGELVSKIIFIISNMIFFFLK